MPILNKLSAAFPATLLYITAGGLIDIWSLAWYVYFPPQSPSDAFWLTGFSASGLGLLIMGLFLGRIGRAARQAELPPAEVTPTIVQVEKTAAANPPPSTSIASDGAAIGIAPVPPAQS
jgi:hypothetical protein